MHTVQKYFMNSISWFNLKKNAGSVGSTSGR